MLYFVTDFDGVFNFEGSRSKATRNKNMPGYLRKGDVYPASGWERLNWSAELVSKLNAAHKTGTFRWVWLTTWVEHTHMVNYALGTTTDDTVMWDPAVPSRATLEELVAIRMARKYEALKTLVKDDVFVWVDDDAGVVYNPDDFSQPHLTVTPDPTYGITLPELDTILTFLNNHSN